MAHLSTRDVLLQLVIVAALCLGPPTVRAHWCDDLWASSYNIVIRPASDTLVVPANGDATLKVWARNNMGYPLFKFSLDADAPGFDVSVAAAPAKVDEYLMPGENLEHVLTVSRTGGSGQLDVAEITFYVWFGLTSPNQDGRYGPNDTDVVVKMADGSIHPARPVPNVGKILNSQAKHLAASAKADFGDLDAAISALMDEYCAGRGSWDSGNANNIPQFCPNETTTVCPNRVTRFASKFDWQHLWSAGQLGHRRGVLGAQQLTTLRQRLVCAWDDSNFAFQSFAALVMGYLGDDGGPARAFLEGIAATGSAKEQNVARAALLLFGDFVFEPDVEACLSSGDAYAEVVCGAALGIVNADDAAVDAELIPRARWVYPDNDNGLGFVAAHALDLVAWDRRQWAVDAGDSGPVTFYGEVEPGDTIPPAAPANVDCSVIGTVADPVLRLSWDAVTMDEDGQPESISGYFVYWGEEARAPACERPNTGCDPYVHSQSTTSLWLEPGALVAGTTYHFAIIATDGVLNESAFSTEVSCVAPSPAHPPTAVITCDPLSGTAPLSVDCDCDASTDPDGDIQSCHFKLDAGAEQMLNPVGYQFDGAGSHTVTVRVVDAEGLEDTDTASISVAAPPNESPVAVAGADPTEGIAPLEVSFSSAGSDDPDGTIVSYLWDFDDGGATSADPSPTHEFVAAGTYDVSLVVTDDGLPPLEGVDVVTVTVDDPPAVNNPPDVSGASATPTKVEPDQLVHFDASGVFDPDGHGLTVEWDFGDGESSTDLVVDHPYDAEDVYLATLSVQDDGVPAIGPVTRNFLITVEVVVVVDTIPPAAPGSVGCNDIGTITEPVLRVSWDSVNVDINGQPESVAGYRLFWGKQARAAACTQPNTGCDPYTHTQATTGVWLEPPGLDAGETYHFAVIATDERLNNSVFSAETSCAPAVPAHPPAAVIHCDPTDGTAPLSVDCDCAASTDPDGDIAECHFKLDAGDEAEGPTTTYEFDDAGSHTVRLRVVDETGLEDTDTVTISVSAAPNQAPVAQAGADPVSGVAPLTVLFSAAGSDDPDGAIASYDWDFDDAGATSTDEAPTHEFTAAGVYDVTLTVTDDGNPPLEGVDVVTITVSDAPEVNHPPDLSDASATPARVAPGEALRFDASGVFDPDGDGFTVAWDFGDDASSADLVVDHAYDEVGDYEAILSAQDDGLPAVGPATRAFGITVTDEVITPAENHPPAVSATVTPETGVAPLTVTCDASATTDEDGDTLTFEWTLGDETVREGAVVEHTFTSAATWAVTLRVTDDADEPFTVTRNFEVVVTRDGEGGDPGDPTVDSGGTMGSGASDCAGGGTSAPAALGLLLAFGLLGVARRRRR